jgi:predicted nucleotidyltransferase
MAAPTRSFAEIARRLIVRTSKGPLRIVWRGAYELVARAVAWSFRLADRHASVYVAGSLGRGEPVYGLSDFDMVVVGERREPLARQLARLERFVPGEPREVLEIAVCEEDDLRRSTAATILDHGLENGEPSGLLADVGWQITAELQERPGVGQPVARWRRIAGPEQRPKSTASDRDRRRLETWLELQYWWRHALRGSLDPAMPFGAQLCVKLVAEPLRAWLWLENGVAPATRREALLAALRELPEEEAVLRQALELERTAHRLPPAPLAEALGFLVRLTDRVAASLARDAAEAGMTTVRLAGSAAELLLPGNAPSAAVPLADWRALAAPGLPDEALAPTGGDPADLATLAATARSWRPGVLPALRSENAIVLPTTETYAETVLRAVACAASDPVSWALLDGRETAAFPELLGWSARDAAQRATVEHAAWLRSPGPPMRRYLALGDTPAHVVTLARLLTAARAGLFAISIDTGDPTLAVTARATAKLADSKELSEALDQGCDALAFWYAEHRSVNEADLEPLDRATRALAVYR